MFASANNKFVISGPFDAHMPDYYVIIKDVTWWLKNEKSIMSWLDTEIPSADIEFSGVVLAFKNSKDALAFILKWS